MLHYKKDFAFSAIYRIFRNFKEICEFLSGMPLFFKKERSWRDFYKQGNKQRERGTHRGFSLAT